MTYELALLNKKMDSFSEYLNKFVDSSLQNQQEISLEEFICPNENPLWERSNNQEARGDPKYSS